MDTILVTFVTDTGGHRRVSIDESPPRGERLPIGRPPALTCMMPCTVRMLPGRYRIYVHGPRGARRGFRDVDIFVASTVVVAPKTLRGGLGAAAGVLGAIALVFGFAEMMGHAMAEGISGAKRSKDCDATCTRDGVLLLGGLVVSPIGWVIFATSTRPSVDVKPFWPYPARTSSEQQYPGSCSSDAFDRARFAVQEIAERHSLSLYGREIRSAPSRKRTPS